MFLIQKSVYYILLNKLLFVSIYRQIASTLNNLILIKSSEIAFRTRFVTYQFYKAAWADRLIDHLMRELPRKGILWITQQIYNTILRLQYFPQDWKRAEVILCFQNLAKYRQLFLPTILYHFCRTLTKPLKNFYINKFLLYLPPDILPDHQFRFQARPFDGTPTTMSGCNT